MKLNKLFLGAIAALASAAMVACSDDAPDVNNGGENGDGGYLAVQIVTPTAASRAATEGGFQNGTTDENRVESVTFFLYDEDGTPYQDPQTYQADDQTEGKFEPEAGTNGENVEKILKVLLVIEKQGAGTKLPAKFLTVLNLDNSTITELGKLNMDALRNRINNYSTNGTQGTFVISNTVYANAGKEICATEITTVYDSETEAKKEENAIEVFVERVVARVDIAAAQGFDANNLTEEITIDTPNDDGTTTQTKYTVKHVITGIGIANSISHSYLFKNIENSELWTENWSNWTDKNNSRSYWAKSATTDDTGTDPVTYTTPAWNDIKTTIENTFYVQENTTSNSDNYTSVIAAVKHQIQENGEWKDIPMIKWAGNLYLPASYPTLMANVLTANGYRVKVETDDNITYRSILPSELEMITEPANQPTDFEQWETCCKLTTATTNLTFVKNVGGTYTDSNSNDINIFLQGKLNRAQYWNDGMAYYYVPIEHFGPTTPYNIGVVRNHLYQLSITGLKGLGTPVFDPDEDIIPNNPGDNQQFYYLAARINILAWKLVKQDVIFGD